MNKNNKQQSQLSHDSCDCFIGFLNDERVKQSELKQKVKDLIRFQLNLKKHGLIEGSLKNASQIVDGRRGYLGKFHYCPYCGNKINWKAVISDSLK